MGLAVSTFIFLALTNTEETKDVWETSRQQRTQIPPRGFNLLLNPSSPKDVGIKSWFP